MSPAGPPPSNELVLLLHGQPGSARDWHRVQAAIGDRARTVAIDRPGWNGRTAPGDLVENARAALAFLDAEGIDRATIVGHSLGAAVSAWLATQAPRRVAALVLAAPSANAASLNRLDHLLAAPVVGPLLGATALAGFGAALSAPPFRDRLRGQLGVDGHYLENSSRMLLRPATWRAFAIEQRLLIRDLPALERRLAQISAPTTIVVGTADRIVSPSSARRLAAEIPGAELVQLERATHLLPLERPQELAEVIVRATRCDRRSRRL